MSSRSIIIRTIGAGILSAAICLPVFATTRYVPNGGSPSYSTVKAANDACNNGDVIIVKSSNSTEGFTVSKDITIQNGSANPTVSLYLSNVGITVTANNVTFDNLKIYGRNSSTARCIQVNAGVVGFGMNGCEITKASGGTTGYGVYDLGSYTSGFYGVKFSGTTEGLYATNMDFFSMHFGSAFNSFNNPNRNIRTRRMDNNVEIDWWIEAINFYAGSSANATCFSAYNANSTNKPWYFIEGCSFQSYGAGAKCWKSETSDAMNDINFMACTFTNCP